MPRDTMNLEDRKQIERLIAGALRNTIYVHGPITIKNHSSAAKRIYCTLKQYAKDKRRNAKM